MMLDGFLVRNGFRERLVTKLKERGYHGRKAGRPVCLEGGAGMCEVAVERRPQNGGMGTWTLGTKGGRGWALEGGFLGGGGLRRLGAKGPRPMHPDAACGVRTHWRWPFHFRTE